MAKQDVKELMMSLKSMLSCVWYGFIMACFMLGYGLFYSGLSVADEGGDSSENSCEARYERFDFNGQTVGNEMVYYDLTEEDWNSVMSAQTPFTLSLLCSTVTDGDLARLAGNQFLEKIDLFDCPKITDGVTEPLSQIPHLKVIVLAKNSQLREPDFSKLTSLHELGTLNLSECGNLTEKGLESLASLSSLQDITLAACHNVTDRLLEKMGQFVELKNLDLTFCEKITDRGIGELASLNRLRSLSLRRCPQITEKGISRLKGLPLFLFAPPEQFYCDEKIGFLTEFSHVVSLVIGANQESTPLRLTDAGLFKLKDMKQLRSLFIANCPAVTQEGVEKLQKELPACRIRFDNRKE